MALSYTAVRPGALAQTDPHAKRRVLVTGAAGRIGSYFAAHSQDKYDFRLMVRGDEDDSNQLRDLGEVVQADLSDLDALKRHCDGIDTIVHMAGDPDPSATWAALREANIDGVYNIFAAAKHAGCRRVIHASSIHAVSGYPPDVQIKTSEPVNPGDLYGVSKCFGEALARYMAEKEGVSAICLRIGAFQPTEAAERPDALHWLDGFVSHRDLCQLIQRSVDAENIKFAVFHGLSNNRFKRLDISDARELLGYDPQDDATALSPQIKDLHLSETVSTHSAIADGSPSGLRDDTS